MNRWTILLVAPLLVFGCEGGNEESAPAETTAPASAPMTEPTTISFSGDLSWEQVESGLNTEPLTDPTGAAKVILDAYKDVCDANPPGSYENAGGTGTVTYDETTRTLKYAYDYSGLSGPPLMMHFHHADAAQGDPIVQTVCGLPHGTEGTEIGHSAAPTSGDTCPSETSGRVEGTYVLAGNESLGLTVEDEVQALLDGKLYLNIHTCLNPAGEVRGNLDRL